MGVRIPSPEYDERVVAAPMRAQGTTVYYDEEYHGLLGIATVDSPHLTNKKRQELAELFASSPKLRSRVQILRDALEAIDKHPTNGNSEPDSMAEALEQIHTLASAALDATKEP